MVAGSWKLGLNFLNSNPKNPMSVPPRAGPGLEIAQAGRDADRAQEGSRVGGSRMLASQSFQKPLMKENALNHHKKFLLHMS